MEIVRRIFKHVEFHALKKKRLRRNLVYEKKIFLSLAILVYRGLRYARKRSLKLSHASIFGSIMLFVIIASWAVYDSHVLALPNPIPNLYSLHSWIGLIAILLFFLQVNNHELSKGYIL